MDQSAYRSLRDVIDRIATSAFPNCRTVVEILRASDRDVYYLHVNIRTVKEVTEVDLLKDPLESVITAVNEAIAEIKSGEK